jgi:3-hydroxyisobutyrate dehydrogenase-like beta-hydroxyacid dehydrogenase
MVVGFVGLGNMGSVLASNLVHAGHVVLAHDALGADLVPEGASWAMTVAELAEQTDVMVLSLPDASASQNVAEKILAVGQRRVAYVVDTSTIGVPAAQSIAAMLARHGVGYLDAPVSGGVSGARARTLAVMVAGADEACAVVQPVLAGLSDRLHRVGGRPGLGQAMKLANNFLSATALAATSEAIAFGTSVGLEMATMIEVLDGASGRSAATNDKFPNHVLTGRYASGFTNSLMTKDLQLYLDAVAGRGSRSTIGIVTAAVWAQFASEEPDADFTRIYPFVERS